MYGFTPRGALRPAGGPTTSTAPEYKESRLRTRSRANTCWGITGGVLATNAMSFVDRLRLVEGRWCFVGFWKKYRVINSSKLDESPPPSLPLPPILPPSSPLTSPLTLFSNSDRVPSAKKVQRIKHRRLLSWHAYKAKCEKSQCVHEMLRAEKRWKPI